MNPLIRPATPASPGFDDLASEAAGEGHRFIARLVREWRSGANRFDGPGELFCGVFRDGALAAVGGLGADPYLAADPATARLRHVYVRAAWRRSGLGEAIVRHLLSLAAPGVRRIRLCTDDPGAARLYERCGFARVSEADASHALPLRG